ncbi:Cell division protein ZapA [Candidatus Methylobacter favarea]|uniref:Cell division protein ZapA n=1 Tax=Candidatus Methylobacter favarea TaxID=2707345 RepID=A0A8S0XH39_9GAMM|nr:cell division protein ZapA [Candidatus Methylobacter favarea]CAA9889401.1 Cell division protein ZapA [Candidatus Methylobacter favarea]
MSRNLQPLSLTILGKEYKIACEPEERDNLIRSAQEIDEQMRKIRDSGKVIGADRIAVVTALNLAHELRSMKNQNASLTKSLNECMGKMLHKIEKVLETK